MKTRKFCFHTYCVFSENMYFHRRRKSQESSVIYSIALESFSVDRAQIEVIIGGKQAHCMEGDALTLSNKFIKCFQTGKKLSKNT